MDKFSAQRKQLSKEMEQYSGKTAPKCKSVGITLRYPVYSDLTPNQLDYYLYWRGTVGTDSFKKAAEGYVWLHVSELLNSSDTGTVSDRLNTLAESTASDGSPVYPEMLVTAVEYAQLNGTAMPRYSEWMGSSKDCDFASRAFASPVSDLPLGFLKDYIPDIQFKNRPDEPVQKVFGTALRAYDGILRRHGGSVRDLFLSKRKSCFLPFREFAYLGPRVPLEKIYWVPDDRKMPELLGALSDLYVGKDRQKHDIPFLDELRSEFSDILSAKAYTASADPFSKEDAVMVRRLGSTPTAEGPSRFYDPLAVHSGKKSVTAGDLLTFGPVPAKGPADFVVSGCEHPSYDDLSKDQFAYYQYWKGCFRNGIYIDTDNGYVNLLLTELINAERGREAHAAIEKLLKVYGDGDGSLIAVTLMDHALANRNRFTDYKLCMGRYTANTWIDEYVNGSKETVLDPEMLGIMRTGSLSVKFVGNYQPLEPLSSGLRNFFRTLSDTKDLRAAFAIEVVTTRRSLYFGLDYLRGPRDCTVRYLNYLGCSKFCKFIDKAAEYVVTLMENLKNGRNEKRPSFTFSGMDCGRIFESEVQIWWALKNKPAEVEIKLDSDAIATAEDDLNKVTELMKTEESEEPAEEEAPAPADTSGDDPWQELRKALTDDEKGYLSECLVSGKAGREFLKSRNLAQPKIEDSINGKSLDTVKDTIIEAGIPVEDYLEEIGRIL